MNRRELLRRTMLAAGWAAAGPLSARWGSAAAEPMGTNGAKTKIVLIGHRPDHPPGTHLYLKECRLLAKCLGQTPGIEAVVSDGWPKQASLLENVSALVLYSSPGAELLLRPDHAAQAQALLKRGVGFTALHWATGIGKNDESKPIADQYLSALGGMFGFGWSKLNIGDSKVEPMAPDHPICRGWTTFPLKDEWYINVKFRPEAKPIAKVRVKDQDWVVAWAFERRDCHGGRSYGNTLGHFHTNFGLEPLRKLMVNGILWTAHREIPAGGAPCAISEEDMILEEPKK